MALKVSVFTHSIYLANCFVSVYPFLMYIKEKNTTRNVIFTDFSHDNLIKIKRHVKISINYM